MRHIVDRDVSSALNEVEGAIEHGLTVDLIVEEMVVGLHSSVLAKEGIGEDKYEDLNKKEVISLIQIVSENVDKLRNAVPEQIPLELAIISWCEGNGVGTGENRVPTSSRRTSKKSKSPVRTRSSAGISEKESAAFEPKLESDGSVEELLSDGVWKRILSEIKPINTSMEALLRASRPMNYDGNTLTLGVFYRFHKERLEENHHRQILERVIEAVLGTPIRVTCTLTQPPVKTKSEKVEEDVEQVNGGGSVVLTEGDDEDIINVAEEIFSG